MRTVFDQTAAEEVHAQHALVVASLEAKHPEAAEQLDAARDDLLAFTGFPRQLWRQIWLNNPQERLNKEVRRRTDKSESSPTGLRSSASSAPSYGVDRRMDAPLQWT